MPLPELSDLSKSMNKTFDLVTQWLEKNGDDVGSTVHSFEQTLTEIKTAVHSINEQNMVPDIKTAVNTFTDTLCDVQDSILSSKPDNVFVNAGVTMKNLSSHI